MSHRFFSMKLIKVSLVRRARALIQNANGILNVFTTHTARAQLDSWEIGKSITQHIFHNRTRENNSIFTNGQK